MYGNTRIELGTDQKNFPVIIYISITIHFLEEQAVDTSQNEKYS